MSIWTSDVQKSSPLVTENPVFIAFFDWLKMDKVELRACLKIVGADVRRL